MSDNSFWEKLYQSGRQEDTPWEIGEPDSFLVQLVEQGKVPGIKVLDVCSGLGTQSIYLAQKGYQVTGVELSQTAAAKAVDRAKKAAVKVNFIRGNVQKIPIEDNTFDFILDRGCLHHQYGEEMKAYLREIKRVLKAGGRMYITAFTSRFTFEEIEDLFAADFKILEHFISKWQAGDRVVREFHRLLIEKT